MKKQYIILWLTTSLQALGSVTLSKEYLFPPKQFAAIESNIQKAAARNSEMQEYPVFFTIDQSNGISLWCSPHMPKPDGTGCSMNFSIKSDSLSIIIKKGLALDFKSQQVIDQLKAIDPNTTPNHQHFGSPFEKSDTFGSHYFCQPEGSVNKSWTCYLFVSESLGAN